VGDRIARPAQARTQDPDEIARGKPAAREALDQLAEIVHGKGRLQLRERAQRQAQPVFAPVKPRGDLAAAPVGRHGATAKVTGPADSSATSKVTSPSWLPVYTSAGTWKLPSTELKSGMANRHVAIWRAKKRARIAASDCASLRMPDPLMEARCTPLPARSSRQRPAESASVTSTVSLLKASRL